MKRLDDYNAKELRELKDKQAQVLIDLECAYEGAPMLPDCPEKPDFTRLPYDIDVYEVFGFYFKTPEEANAILTVFQKSVAYVSDGYSNDKRLSTLAGDGYDYPKVKPTKMYSIETWNDIKNKVEKNKQIENEYNSKKSDYDIAAKARSNISEIVWERIFNARNKEADRNLIRKSYQSYLSLAGNDSIIAMNFLIKADPQIDVELIRELCPEYEAPNTEDKGE